MRFTARVKTDNGEWIDMPIRKGGVCDGLANSSSHRCFLRCALLDALDMEGRTQKIRRCE